MKVYRPQFTSRLPSPDGTVCECFKEIAQNDRCSACSISDEFSDDIVRGVMLKRVGELLKPVLCGKCNSRFPDVIQLKEHCCDSTTTKAYTLAKAPNQMSVSELKRVLREKNLSTTGNKDVLVQRLEFNNF